MATVDVVLEHGRRRTFASALDWPGWARSATSPDAALHVLESYRVRYAEVLARRALATPTSRLVVVETVEGDAGTDFGAPTRVASRDHRALRAPDRTRLAAILGACWARFDEVAASTGALRTGPRGGGRDVERMTRHVLEAEVAYARRMGLRAPGANGDRARVDALRARVVGVVLGTEMPEREGALPVRYVVRRIAWHVCDHLFELEDRAIE